MEQILNIDKAIEIAQKHHVIYDDYYDSIQECIESCREAMQLKDKQFQKVLDYTENCYGVFSFEQREKFINRIKNIFYEKE